MNLDDLPQYYRDRIVVDDDCWRWKGPVVGGKPRSARGHGHSSWVRREIYIRLKGPVPDGMVLMHSCDDDRCVHPDHETPMTRKKEMLTIIRTGMINHDAKWRANITAARRKRSTLTTERVRELRARKHENHTALALEAGITVSTLESLLRGKHWKDPPGALALLAQQAGLL